MELSRARPKLYIDVLAQGEADINQPHRELQETTPAFAWDALLYPPFGLVQHAPVKSLCISTGYPPIVFEFLHLTERTVLDTLCIEGPRPVSRSRKIHAFRRMADGYQSAGWRDPQAFSMNKEQ